MKIDNIKIAPKWSRSSEEIWASAFEKLEDTPKVVSTPIKRRSLWFYAIASAFIIAMMLSTFAYLYTKTEVAERGNHLAVILPDKSKIDINADSEISYKPLWWIFSREVKLKGEAYFEVEKGSKFDVISGKYRVSVLGTSFNVYSRAERFDVTCLTGKVSVTDNYQSVIITPNMQAHIDGNRLVAKEVSDAQEFTSWMHDKFVFVGTPLKDVIAEIERQYDIEVLPNTIPEYSYSGNFTKTNNPNDVLKIVGTPFGIEFKIK